MAASEWRASRSGPRPREARRSALLTHLIALSLYRSRHRVCYLRARCAWAPRVALRLQPGHIHRASPPPPRAPQADDEAQGSGAPASPRAQPAASSGDGGGKKKGADRPSRRIETFEEVQQIDYIRAMTSRNVWYYRDRLSVPRGPCTMPVLREAWANGVIDETTLVW